MILENFESNFHFTDAVTFIHWVNVATRRHKTFTEVVSYANLEPINGVLRKENTTLDKRKSFHEQMNSQCRKEKGKIF